MSRRVARGAASARPSRRQPTMRWPMRDGRPHHRPTETRTNTEERSGTKNREARGGEKGGGARAIAVRGERVEWTCAQDISGHTWGINAGKEGRAGSAAMTVSTPGTTAAADGERGRLHPRWLHPRWPRLSLSALTRAEWTYLGALLLAYAYFLAPANTNTISRYDMVYALAHGTAIIDSHAANTIDVSAYNGHFYSPRSLGLSLLAVPIFRLFAFMADRPAPETALLTAPIYILNLFTVVPVAAAAALVFPRFVARLRPALAGTPLPLVVATAFALGTLFFPFAAVFFSHAFAGGLAFLGFYLLYRARASAAPTRFLLAAGLLVGFAVISEYPAAVIAAALCVYAWAVFPGRRARALALFVAGTLPSVAL